MRVAAGGGIAHTAARHAQYGGGAEPPTLTGRLAAAPAPAHGGPWAMRRGRLTRSLRPARPHAAQDAVRFLFGSHDSPRQELYTLSQLLPSRFGPLDLLEPSSAPLLLERQDNQLAWAPSAARRVAARGAAEPTFAAAAAAALEAAQRVGCRPGAPDARVLKAAAGRRMAGGCAPSHAPL